MSVDTSLTEPVIHPRTVRHFFEGRIKSAAFGKSENFAYFNDDPNLTKQVAQSVYGYGVRKLYVPDCRGFNAWVGSRSAFKPSLLKNKFVEILGNVKVDGVFLKEEGEACALQTGDCPTLMIRFPDVMFVGHAGLGSVIDLGALRKDGTSRGFESLVDSVFANWKGDVSQVRAAVVCGIQAHSYSHPDSHPVYGAFNKKLIHHIKNKYGGDCISEHTPSDESKGRINLFKIIRAQLELYGVSPGSVIHDNENTADGACQWWSHRRWVESKLQKKESDGRNLVIGWL